MAQRVLLYHHHFNSSSAESPKELPPIELSKEEAHHLIHVMRMQNDEPLHALDGRGGSCVGKLQIIGQKIFFKATESPLHSEHSNTLLPITLMMSVLKGEAMEWVVEKSVELGVQRFQPLLTDHCVIQIQKKGPQFFQERWQKIADQSLKQCGRVFRMEVCLPISLDSISPQINSTLIWCDEISARETFSQSEHLGTALKKINFSKEHHYSILIGPEGGWSEKERTFLEKKNATKVHLGSLILRAETAALYSASILSFLIKNS